MGKEGQSRVVSTELKSIQLNLSLKVAFADFAEFPDSDRQKDRTLTFLLAEFFDVNLPLLAFFIFFFFFINSLRPMNTQ